MKPHKVSVRGAQLGPKAAQGLGRGCDMRPMRKGEAKSVSEAESGARGEDEDESCLPDSDSYEFGSRLDLPEVESAVAVFGDREEQSLSLADDKNSEEQSVSLADDKNREEQPLSLADDKSREEQPLSLADDKSREKQSLILADDKDVLDSEPFVSSEAVQTAQQPNHRVVQRVPRHAPPKRCTTEHPTTYSDAEAGHSRSLLARKFPDAKLATAFTSLHCQGPKVTRVCRKKKSRVTKTKKIIQDNIQEANSDPDSPSEDNSEVQVISVTIRFKNGEQIISGSPMDPGNKSKKKNGRKGNNLHHMTGSLPTTPSSLSSGMKKLGDSCSNRKRSLLKGREGSRSSYPETTAAAAAAAAAAATATPAEGVPPPPGTEDSLPKANPKNKTAKEQKLGGASRVLVGRGGPSWGKRSKAAPVEPPTFSSVTSLPTIMKPKRCSLMPLGPKEPTYGAPGKRSVSRATRETQPMIGGDKGHSCAETMKYPTAMIPTPEPPKVQESLQDHLPTHRAKQPGLCMGHGELSGEDPNTKAPQAPGNPRLLAPSQRGTRSKALASSGDQEPPVSPLLPLSGNQQYPPAAMGCGQCPDLEEEVDKLKEQLAAMKALTEKFQAP